MQVVTAKTAVRYGVPERGHVPEAIDESENREQAMNGFRYYFGTRLSVLVHKGVIFMVCSSLTGLCQSYKPKQINGSGYSAAW